MTHPHPDDEALRDLHTRLVAGDAVAFDGLVRRLQDPLYALCLRLCGDRDEAFDLAQDAFLKLHLELPRWRPTGSIRAWCLRVAVNAVRDRLRGRAWRERGSSVPVDEARDASRAADASPEAAASGNEVLAVLERAAAELPRKEHEAFVLFYFQRLAVAEVAAATGCTPGHVKVLLFRARRRIMLRPDVQALKEVLHALS